MTTSTYWKGRATNAPTPASPVTLQITPNDDGFLAAGTLEARWPDSGQVAALFIRQTDGATGNRFAWSLYSEDPAAVTAGRDLGEFLIASALDESAVDVSLPDNRAFAVGDVTQPDVLVNFIPPAPWSREEPTSTATGSLWIVITPGVGTRTYTVWVQAGPRKPEAGV